jgi:hypothetical protein
MKYPERIVIELAKYLSAGRVNENILRVGRRYNSRANISSNDISIQDLWGGFFLYDVRENYPDNIWENFDQWAGKKTGKSWRIGRNKKIEFKKI